MTLQLPDHRVVTEREIEPRGPDSLSTLDRLTLGCEGEGDGPDPSPIVESPMPAIRSQQGRPTHLVLLTLLSGLVVGAFVGLPLALFVHGLTRRPLVATVTALLVLTVIVGGVVRGLRATTRTLPPKAPERADHAASEATDQVAPATKRAPLSLAELMARDPQVVRADRQLALES